MKYRKKPVEVEAFKYKGDLLNNGKSRIPKWATEAFAGDVMHYVGTNRELYIKTLEGEHLVNVGDYIIKGVKGELYPCKPDIFEMTYEMALKPCPFCGGEARIREIYWAVGSGRQKYECEVIVECPNCKASRSADTRDEAIKSWNGRA